MIIYGLENILNYIHGHADFYLYNRSDLRPDCSIRVHGGERDFADEDYPGPGLEASFFEIPNI
jgi:hypothetical protein